ncbi:MAG: hypothetical protein ABH816_03220 [Candidatus Levyibacteriota bacterium]
MDENNNPINPAPNQPVAGEPSQPTPPPAPQTICTKCGGSANNGNCVACNQSVEGCTCTPVAAGGDTGQSAPAV